MKSESENQNSPAAMENMIRIVSPAQMLVAGRVICSFPWLRGAESIVIANIQADHAAYRSGDLVDSIAKRRGVSDMTIRKIFKALGLPLRSRGGQQVSHRKRYAQNNKCKN